MAQCGASFRTINLPHNVAPCSNDDHCAEWRKWERCGYCGQGTARLALPLCHCSFTSNPCARFAVAAIRKTRMIVRGKGGGFGGERDVSGAAGGFRSRNLNTDGTTRTPLPVIVRRAAPSGSRG